MLTGSTSTPRSASSSSTFRYDSPNRKYQRTARVMTSAGKRKPAKAEVGTGTDKRRRRGTTPVSLVLGGPGQRNSARILEHEFGAPRPHHRTADREIAGGGVQTSDLRHPRAQKHDDACSR